MVKSLIDSRTSSPARSDADRRHGGERIKRGHTNGPIKVSLPDGWLYGRRRRAALPTSRCPTTTRSWPCRWLSATLAPGRDVTLIELPAGVRLVWLLVALRRVKLLRSVGLEFDIGAGRHRR